MLLDSYLICQTTFKFHVYFLHIFLHLNSNILVVIFWDALLRCNTAWITAFALRRTRNYLSVRPFDYWSITFARFRIWHFCGLTQLQTCITWTKIIEVMLPLFEMVTSEALLNQNLQPQKNNIWTKVYLVYNTLPQVEPPILAYLEAAPLIIPIPRHEEESLRPSLLSTRFHTIFPECLLKSAKFQDFSRGTVIFQGSPGRIGNPASYGCPSNGRHPRKLPLSQSPSTTKSLDRFLLYWI